MTQENIDPFWFKEGGVDSLWLFILAINWKEKWLIGVVTFHLICTLLIILTRKLLNTQVAFLFILCGLTLSAEKLNEFGAKYWKMFAKEQYFDYNGQFISVVWSLPIVINSLFIVIIWLIQTGQLLIKTKQRQIIHVQDSNKPQHEKSE